MVLKYKKLNVAATILAKAVYKFLAHVVKVHTRCNKTHKLIASVVTSLACNQRLSISPATLPKRAPE